MQKNRLFEIVYLLLERPGMTAAQLAERFEVSPRTIYRDIDALSAAGIPVYAEKGRGGGIRLMEDYVLNKSILSKEEQDEILFALQSMKAAGAVQDDALFKHLKGFFQREQADWIQVDFSSWGNMDGERERFDVLKQSILERRVIRFIYYNTMGEQSRRQIQPLKLCFKNNAWYLVGFCLDKQEMRTFKLHRMERVQLTDERFKPRETPPQLYMPSAKPHQVVHLKLLFSPEVAYRVYDDFHAAQIEKQEDGRLLVETWWPLDDWVYGHLLSFGGSVKVLSPEHVRQTLCGEALRILEACREDTLPDAGHSE
ncbi:helix-turn-helix transcriptional regulator [Candidatus Soleaferrea massiliensis]|uniref:helix-turn-helix transcriptional regulator n=1 Tax=Candidatus Soleaferrea massiliensis TaxID=1470354 RepID=UPI00058F67EF|nr:YafY family protein [Candidatus Soleaferrea massiliensis]